MLMKLDIHPFLVEIDLCEFLIKYCEKQLGKDKEADMLNLNKMITDEDRKEQEERRKKAI
jgi:hypothetical protein